MNCVCGERAVQLIIFPLSLSAKPYRPKPTHEFDFESSMFSFKLRRPPHWACEASRISCKLPCKDVESFTLATLK